jgi:signal transduction histidine kinase
MESIARAVQDLPIKRKTFLIAGAMALPLFLMIGAAAAMLIGASASASRAADSMTRTEKYFGVVERIDRLNLIIADLSHITSAAAPARFEPYSDEPLYPEFERRFIEFVALADQVTRFAVSEDARSSAEERKAGILRIVENAGTVRSIFTGELRIALAETAALQLRYDEVFLRQESLVAHYGALLERAERNFGGGGDAASRLKAAALTLARVRYQGSAGIALKDRNRPFLEEAHHQELRRNALAMERALAELAPGQEPEAEYRRNFAELRSVAEREYARSLEEWSAEKGRLELRILKADQRIAQLIADMLAQATGVSESLRTELNAETVARAEAQRNLQGRAAGNLALAAALGALSLAATLSLAKLFDNSIAGPVRAAAVFADSVRSGERNLRLSFSRKDEIGLLADALDSMVQELERKAGALEEAKETLEQRVEERTEHLERALAELSEAQEKLILEGKFSTLGRLSANMAHELNTPLGAIASANRTISRFFRTDLGKRMATVRSLPDAEFEWLGRVVAGTIDSGNATHRSGRERRKLLRQEFERLGAADPERLADAAAELDMDGPPEPWPPPCAEERAVALLGIAAEAASIRRLSDIVGISAEKASRVVGDLRDYLRGGDAESRAEYDPAEDLAATIALLRPRIGQKVEVETEFQGGARVYGSRHALSQVWTNLIVNAFQAMQGAGTLVLRTGAAGADTFVQIQDDGPGIPAAILPRIFEPFFTTKPPGEGMGLGLDICRTIVGREGGRIEAASEPGRTAFTVYLPAVKPA